MTFVYCFAQLAQIEGRTDEGRLYCLWLLVMVILFMLYGFYTWRT